MEPRCEVCGVSNNLLLCARCKIVFYCSKDHQSRDWKNHKSHCKFNLRDNSNVSLEMLSHPPDEKTSGTINSKSEDGNSSTIVLDSRENLEEMSLQGDVQVLPPFLHRSSGDVHEDICKNIIRDMNIYGLCVIDNFLGRTKGLTVLDEVIAIHETGVFKDGQLVSSSVKTDLKTIRSDKITWVDGKEPSCSNISYLINQVDTMVMKANTMRSNGKMGDYKINGRTKAMIACYPGNGSHYVKHVDNPNRDGRCITAIYYLNRDWIVTKHGGLLRIFPEGWRSQVADISPVFDRLLLFWSDRRNPHEVQPAHRTRFAITLWYFDATEREEAYKRFQRTKTVSSGDSESIKT